MPELFNEALNSLPELWEAWADIVSGRTTELLDPPRRALPGGGYWSAPQAPDTITSGSTAETVQVNLCWVVDDVVEDTGVLTCPRPEAAMYSLRATNWDLRWRRSVLGGDTGYYSLQREVDLTIAYRQAILELVWGPYHDSRWAGPQLTYPVDPPDGPTLRVSFLVISHLYQPIQSASYVYTVPPPPTRPVWTFTSDVVVDTAAVCFTDTGLVDVPDNYPGLADWLQFPGGGDVINSAELAALNALAERLAAASAERSNRVTDHRDRTLLTTGGRPVELPTIAWTADSILKRLARAVAAYAAPDTILLDPKTKAQIGLQSGLLIPDTGDE